MTLAAAHGVIAWVATVALAVGAALLIRGHARARWVAVAALTLTALAAALGAPLSWAYRQHMRQRLFIHSADLGWLFERKLHVSAVLTALALATLALLAAAPHAADPRLARELRRGARVGVAIVAALALFASVASRLAVSSVAR